MKLQREEEFYTKSGLSGLDLILEEGRQRRALRDGDFSCLHNLDLTPLIHAKDKQQIAKKITELKSFKQLSNRLSIYPSYGLEEFANLLNAITRMATQGHLGTPYASSHTTHEQFNPPEAVDCLRSFELCGKLLQQAYSKRSYVASPLRMSQQETDDAFKDLAEKLMMCVNHAQQPNICKNPW